MRIKFTLGLDIQRHPSLDRYVIQEVSEAEPERAPDAVVKGSYILDRAPSPDFDPEHRMGFLRNPEEIR